MKRLAIMALGAACFAAHGQTAFSGYPEAALAPVYAADTGSVNALAATVNGCPAAYTTGMVIRVKPANANTTTTPTLNFCGLGAKTITKLGTTAVAASDLTTTAIAVFVYDGSGMQLQNPQVVAGGGNVSTGSTLTSGIIPKASGSATIVNSALDDGVSTANTLTYSGTGGMSLTGSGADLFVGAAAPAITAGTSGGSIAVEGTAPTGISGSSGWYADSTSHCLGVMSQTVNGGCALSTSHQAGPASFSGSQQSQVTVAATSYYITGSGILTPSSLFTGYQVGTTWSWRVSGIVKNANGTGATSFIVYNGTNGSTSDTAKITQAWGTAGTAVADVAELDVVCKITAIVTTTATVNCGIAPEHHLASTGWVTTAVGGYNASFTFTTTTTGLYFGLGFQIAAGGTMPTVTIAAVNAQAYNLY